jgi:hypothetical protein
MAERSPGRRKSMTRAHRRWHAWLWLVLGPLLAAGFIAGLLARPAPVSEPAPPEPRQADGNTREGKAVP